MTVFEKICVYVIRFAFLVPSTALRSRSDCTMLVLSSVIHYHWLRNRMAQTRFWKIIYVICGNYLHHDSAE